MVREKTLSHVIPTIEASIHEVKESGLESRAIQPGEAIRDFELPDATCAMVKSLELRTRGPLLIVFYRGAWCPFCNLTLQALQDGVSQIAIEGFTSLAFLPQTPPLSLPLMTNHSLHIPL